MNFLTKFHLGLVDENKSLKCHRWCYGGGGKGGSNVAAPDPVKTAEAQGAANKEAIFESARVNQINQQTPYGNVSFSGEIGQPNRTQTLTLPDEAQRILEKQRGIAGGLTDFAQEFVPRVQESLSTPFSTDNLDVPAPEFNQQFRNDFEQSLYDRINPQLDRQRAALENQLVNQGLVRGSEAFDESIDEANRAQNDLRLAITGQGQQQLAQDFGLQQQSRNQALSDALLNRSQPLNEVAALLQGSPAIATPQLPQTAQYQVAPADYLGAQSLATQVDLANASRRGQSQSGLMGGLAGLGGSLFGGIGQAGGASNFFSDRRVKTDIKRVGKTDGGLPVYTFRYKIGGPGQMGVMAQDVEKVKPEAVVEVNGIKAVNYAEVN